MIPDSVQAVPNPPDGETQSEVIKQEGVDERAALKREVQEEALLGTFESAEEETAARAALDFAYAQGYLTLEDSLQYQREVVTLLQEATLWHGELSAIPDELIQSFLKDQTIQKRDNEMRQGWQERDEKNEERDSANKALIALQDKFPNLEGLPLVDVMIGALNENLEATNYASQMNILMVVKILFQSEATAPAVQEALSNGKGFDVATLAVIAGSFFDDPDVSEGLKADLRNRLGLVETIKKSVGRIPADPRDLKRQLKERATRTIRREVKRPDGTTEIIEETERILEPIVYSNGGMPIEFCPSPTNEQEWQVSAWRPSGPPLKFTIGTQEMTRGLSSLNWLLATQALEAAGFTYPFGGGIASEEIGHMERDYTIFSYGLGLAPEPGQMWIEANTRKTLLLMQSLHIRGDWAQSDVNTDWKINAQRLGLYSVENTKWDLRALQFLRVRLDAELATTGAPEFENLLAIMAEGGFGEEVEEN